MTTGATLDKRYAERARARDDLSVATMTRRLQLCGLSITEAANLTARLRGLPAVESGWSARQIAHLLFLRSILETGRLVP